MKQKLVNIKLHNQLGKAVGENWKLAVSSVGEAVRAIEILSKRKLYKFLIDNDKKGLKYQVLINKRNFLTPEPLDVKKPETALNSELAMKIGNLDTIDIVPVIEGAESGSIGAIIAGVLLIIVGIITFGEGGGYLIVAGVGLIAAGVINLLSPQPEFEDFREFTGGKNSYLFNGPQNTTREGGPVPVGYGRLLVGSQVIGASYEVSEISASENGVSQ